MNKTLVISKPIAMSLPSKKIVEQAIEAIESFREACVYQLDVGLWMTIDFPSKHHLNRLLSLQYRSREDMVSAYGEGLTDHLLKTIPYCKAYVAFTR